MAARSARKVQARHDIVEMLLFVSSRPPHPPQLHARVRVGVEVDVGFVFV